MGLTRQLAGAAVGAAALAGSATPLYLGALTAVGLGHRSNAQPTTGYRFVIVVPAHNEADVIAGTLDSLRRVDGEPRIVVIADNCTDRTADVARECGADVIERSNPDERGKGYALAFAFDHELTADADAVVVIDADTLVDPQLLLHAAWHLDQDAEAVQADYRVRNPDSSWRTQLMDVAFTAKHLIRTTGRERLGLSAGLRGNGMVFRRSLLDAIEYQSFSAVEDVEYGLQIAASGRRVHGCTSAWVAGDMPATADDAASQRIRWEAGHRTVRDQGAAALVAAGIADADPVQVDAAIDVALPPLATAVAYLGGATLLAGLTRPLTGPFPARVVAAGWIGLVGHVAAAIAACQSPARALKALGSVPTFLWWKLGLTQPDHVHEWVRTERSDDARSPVPSAPGSDPEVPSTIEATL